MTFTAETAALALIVALAFTVEGALGFGATLVAVTLSAFLVPIDVLLPSFVPLNMILSASIVARSWRAVDVRLLFFRIVPWMGLGLPLGMWTARHLDGHLLVKGFGLFVAVLAMLELRARHAAQPSNGSRAGGNVLLALGGLVHGAFGTGGPMAVYVAGRSLVDKAAFRATLSALWIVLNVVLVGGFAMDGRVNASSVTLSAMLAAGLVAGIVLGEILHKKVPVTTFRVVVWAALAVAGVALALR